MSRELHLTPTFERLFKRLPKEIQDQAYAKLALFLEDPSHPSLRVKKVNNPFILSPSGEGSKEDIWELSVTMNYRITFEQDADRILLRRIGTHDVLREP